MSWSFTVKAENEADALREFGNKIEEHKQYILNEDLKANLQAAAEGLSHQTKDGYYVLLGCSGHVNDDDTLWATVSINTAEKIPEAVPNTDGEVVIDANDSLPSDEDLREHDPKPGDDGYEEWVQTR